MMDKSRINDKGLQRGYEKKTSFLFARDSFPKLYNARTGKQNSITNYELKQPKAGFQLRLGDTSYSNNNRR